MSNQVVTAVILCGGQGTRLRPVIGESLPKCLAPVAGRPFLEYVLEHLVSQGVRKVVLCLGAGGEKIHEHVRSSMRVHLAEMLSFSWEAEPLGTGGALRHALGNLDTDPVLVLNGDTFCKFDLKKLLWDYHMHPNQSRILYDRDCSTGVRVVARADLLDMPANEVFDLDEYLTSHRSNPFVDIGTPEGYAAAEGFLRGQGVLPCL